VAVHVLLSLLRIDVVVACRCDTISLESGVVGYAVSQLRLVALSCSCVVVLQIKSVVVRQLVDGILFRNDPL